MTLTERLERLEERERRLLGIFALVVAVVVLLMIPVAVTAVLHGSRSENVALREAIAELESSRSAIEHSRALKAALEDRYSRPAPPLSAFLSKLAGETEVEILESTDRQPVPHGKRYEEKATQVSLRKVGMYKLARFMESIEQSGHPVSITQLKIRKRGVEPDSFDVDMAVSAFERKPEKVQVKPAAEPADTTEGAP
jgi:general secretion pathway protein M